MLGQTTLIRYVSLIASKKCKKIIWIILILIVIISGIMLMNMCRTSQPSKSSVTIQCPFVPPRSENTNGGWFYTKDLIAKEHVQFDPGFGQALITFFHNKDIVDIGAGVGQFGYFLQKHNVTTVKWTGFDGGNNIQDFIGKKTPVRGDPNHIVPKVCWMDAAAPIKLSTKYDWVMSIEVGEHIPKQFESIFLDNLVMLSKDGVVLSWAVKGQGGHDHINKQPNEYIINEMYNRGLSYDNEQSVAFRKQVTQSLNPKNTIMVFRNMSKIKGINICPFVPPQNVNTNGGWYYTNELIKTSHVTFDSGFGIELVQFLSNKDVVDIGAGVGQFGYFLQKHNVTNVKWTGFDGGNNIQNFIGKTLTVWGNSDYTVPKVCWIDAAAPIKLLTKYDWVMSIEVGEHIPKQFESIFLDNLVMLSKDGVVLSWAVKGQGGHGHVNEQPNEYIINEMYKRGLRYDSIQSFIFRYSVSSLLWLKNTIMVFRKE